MQKKRSYHRRRKFDRNKIAIDLLRFIEVTLNIEGSKLMIRKASNTYSNNFNFLIS